MTRIVDVHCHVAPVELPADPTGGRLGDQWPCMHCDGGHEATFVVAGKTRKFDSRTWDPAQRIDHMDSHGIELQVLSPLPDLLGYHLDASATKVLNQHVNNVLAEMVSGNPDRFAALGGIPMNDPQLAVEEAKRLKSLGFVGVEIGSNIAGISPADPRHVETLATLQELDLSVFVHGVSPATEGRLIGPEVLAPIVGIPMDTALCVASFIGAGIPNKLPELRVGFSHGGGALGAVLDRFQHVWNVMPPLQEAVTTSPIDGVRAFYYDILTFGADYTRFLIDRIGADRFFVGTDFPAAGMGLMDPETFLKELHLNKADYQAIARDNGLAFLGKATS